MTQSRKRLAWLLGVPGLLFVLYFVGWVYLVFTSYQVEMQRGSLRYYLSISSLIRNAPIPDRAVATYYTDFQDGMKPGMERTSFSVLGDGETSIQNLSQYFSKHGYLKDVRESSVDEIVMVKNEDSVWIRTSSYDHSITVTHWLPLPH